METLIKSESINNLAEALCKFQSNQGTIAYNAQNPFLKNKYADLTALIQGTKENLKENGLCVTQLLSNEGILTLLLHTSGEYIGNPFKIEPTDAKGTTGAQQMGIAITYTRRYAYAAILGLVTDADADGNHGNKNGNGKKETKSDPPQNGNNNNNSSLTQLKNLIGTALMQINNQNADQCKEYLKELTMDAKQPEKYPHITDRNKIKSEKQAWFILNQLKPELKAFDWKVFTETNKLELLQQELVTDEEEPLPF